MIDDQLRRRAIAGPHSAVLQHGVHVLPMKHVVDISPALFVVVEVVDANGLAGLPIAVDELLEHHGVALGYVDAPFVKPARAVSRARYRGADLSCKVGLFVYCHVVAGSAQRNRHRHAADAAANDTDIEPSPALGGSRAHRVRSSQGEESATDLDAQLCPGSQRMFTANMAQRHMCFLYSLPRAACHRSFGINLVPSKPGLALAAYTLHEVHYPPSGRAPPTTAKYRQWRKRGSSTDCIRTDVGAYVTPT